VIIFDTNVLPLVGSLDNVLMSSILRVAEHSGRDVLIPEIVLHESVNLRREAVDSAVQQLLTVISQASRLFEVPAIYLPDPLAVSLEWEAELRDRLNVLQLDGEDAAEALCREAKRLVPAKEGRGGRDSAIWLSVRRAAMALSDSDVIFVSANTGDFADPQNKNELHPDLVAELGDAAPRLTYLNSTTKLLDHIATKAEFTPNPEDFRMGEDSEIETDILTDLFNFHLEDDRFSDAIGYGFEDPDVRTIRAFQVQEDGLALVDLGLTVELEDAFETADDRARARWRLRLRAWITFAPATGRASRFDVDQLVESVELEMDNPAGGE
jgi:hypothetical protein